MKSKSRIMQTLCKNLQVYGACFESNVISKAIQRYPWQWHEHWLNHNLKGKSVINLSIGRSLKYHHNHKKDWIFWIQKRGKNIMCSWRCSHCVDSGLTKKPLIVTSSGQETENNLNLPPICLYISSSFNQFLWTN